MEQNKQTKQGT